MFSSILSCIKSFFESFFGEKQKEVSAQGSLTHANPLGGLSIGDSHIEWYGDIGSPVDLGATINGDAYYKNEIVSSYYKANYVVLTENVNPSLGSVAWQKNYDYLNKNILVKATTYSGDGTGADGITFFFGSTSASHSRNDANNALAVYIDEWDNDTIKIYINGVLQISFATHQTLDDETYRSWTIVLNSTDQTVSVYMNNAFQIMVSTSSWSPTGNYIGVSAVTVGQNNIHLLSHYQVISADPWLATNQ